MLFVGMNIDVLKGMNCGLMAIAAALVCVPAGADEGLSGLVDPTRPAAVSYAEVYEPVPAGPVVQSIFIAPGKKRALISGKTYTVGEQVGAAVITDIRPYEVILDHAGRETRLRLVPPLMKENVRSSTDNVKGVTQ